MRVLYIGKDNENVIAIKDLKYRLQQLTFIFDQKHAYYATKYKFDIVIYDTDACHYQFFHLLIAVRNKNPKCIIISTAKKDLNIKVLFKAPVFHFAYPQLTYKLPPLIDSIHHEKYASMTLLQNKKQEMILLYKADIIYMCVSGHDVTIKTLDDTLTITGSLKSLLSHIDDSQILQIEKGIAVNIRYIKFVYTDYIQLRDNTVLKLGRTFRSILKERFSNEEYLISA